VQKRHKAEADKQGIRQKRRRKHLDRQVIDATTGSSAEYCICTAPASCQAAKQQV